MALKKTMFQWLKNAVLQEHPQWFSWIPVLFGLGIGVYFILPHEPSKWIILGVIELLLLLAYIFRSKMSVLFVIGVLSIISLGFASIELKSIYIKQTLGRQAEDKLYVSGIIEKIDKNSNGKQRIVLKNMQNEEEGEIKGKYRLTMMQKNPDLVVGDWAEMIATVSPPFTAPYVGGYQFDRKLFFDGIVGTGFVSSGVYKDEEKSQNAGFIFHLRKKISSIIYKALPKDEAAVALAIIAGNQDEMSQKLINQYRDSGLAHFLSISGLHMSMLVGISFFLVRFLMSFFPYLLLRYDSKKIAAVFAIFVSVFYLLVSGAAISTQRAFIASLVVLLAVLYGRMAISMRTLALAALIILVLSPQSLISAGFQMSFAAVAALIAFYEKYAGKIRGLYAKCKKNPLFYLFAYIFSIAVADLIASLATLPFGVYHFGKVAFYTTLTNVVCGPVIGLVVMPFVLLSLLLMPLGLGYLPLKVAGWGIWVLNEVTAYVSALPNSTAQGVMMPFWGFMLIVVGGLWVCLWRANWRHLGWIAIIIGGFSIMSVKTPNILIDKDAKTIALKQEDGKLAMPKKGKRWAKEVWASRYGKSAKVLDVKDLPKVQNSKIYIKSKEFDITGSEGGAFYISGDEVEFFSIRKYMGYRLWNM